MLYEIRVQGHLNHDWSNWFCHSLSDLTHMPNGETIIRGDVPDQAALYGVLTMIRDLGLTLNSVVAVRKESDGQP